MRVEAEGQQRQAVHRLAVDADDDVGDAQAGEIGGPAGQQVRDDHAPVLPELKSTREVGRDRLQVGADLTLMELAKRAQLVIRDVHDRARNAQNRDPRCRPTGNDVGIDPDQLAVDVDERAAAVAVIDRRVGLDIHHRTIGVRLPRDIAHDPHRHRVTKPLRDCRRRTRLPPAAARRSWRAGAPAGPSSRSSGAQIDLPRNADDPRVHRAAACADERSDRRVARGRRGDDHLIPRLPVTTCALVTM